MNKVVLSNLKIQKATKENSQVAQNLMELAFDEQAELLLGSKDSNKTLNYFKRLWESENNRFSSDYSYVINYKDSPIALLSVIKGESIDPLFLPTFLKILRIHPGIIIYILKHPNYLYSVIKAKEAHEDEFYIFMLAVLPEFQNHGLGSILLGFAEEKAKELGYKKCSLMVRIKNPSAIRLYERQGYKIVDEYPRKPIEAYRMVKILE